jgi:3-dehydroquinate dehydratase-2
MASSRGSILLLNGPNLNLLGQREPDIYGAATLEQHVDRAAVAASALGFSIVAVQSNSASELVDVIQTANGKHCAIIINPGAFTHYAWSIHDALKSFSGPVIELHLSNPLKRESWRHTSVVSPVALGTIAGFGGLGYVLSVHAVAQHLA